MRAQGLAAWLSVVAALTGAVGDDTLHVHIVPHSHCDPGWLSTFEGYYTSDVNRIISSVVDQLLGDPMKRFVWAEISFFSRWYESQSLARKRAFRKLVAENRFEFVGGGWAQNDEAASDTMLVVNQVTTGHQYLQDNFGVQPRIGWQIDPFGHSAITPSLFKSLGFDALVINRIHHQKKREFKQGKLMEFMWRGSRLGLGDTGDMFTHVLHTHYSAPKGFDWEEGAPQVGSNVEGRAQALISALKGRRQAYRTPHLLVPFGDDFKFKNAANQFQNMDALVRHINSNSNRFGATIKYSTLSEYFAEVRSWASTSDTKFPLFMGDFFPYADNEDSYWTGFYTTRPFLKKLSRQVQPALRSAEAVYALARANIFGNDNAPPAGMVDPATAASNWMRSFELLRAARQNAAIFSHHDAITGTCRSNVAQDYVSRMNSALNSVKGVLESYLSMLMTEDPSKPPRLTHALRTLDAPSGAGGCRSHPVVVYNSLGWPRTEVVNVRVASRYARVVGPDGKAVPSQADPVFNSIYDPNPHPNDHDIWFAAKIPPLGAATYTVTVCSTAAAAAEGSGASVPLAELSTVTDYEARGGGVMQMLRGVGGGGGGGGAGIQQGDVDGQVTMENDVYKIELGDCLVKAITSKQTGQRAQLKQSFAAYSTRKSGAYIFRPLRPADRVDRGRVKCRVFRGPVVHAMRGQYGNYEAESVLAQGEPKYHSRVLQQKLTVLADMNQELVTRFETDLKNDRRLATHNGIEFMPREALHGGNIARNFWPMVRGMRMSDQSGGGGGGGGKRVLTVLNSHTVGCGSQNGGEFELMLHRQLNQDDGRGLSEAVRDGSRPQITLWFSLSDAERDQEANLQALRLNNPVHVLLDAGAGGTADAASTTAAKPKPLFAPLTAEMPANVHIMTLAVRDSSSDETLLRLQHIDSLAPARAATFNLPLGPSVFAAHGVSGVARTTLSGNHVGAVHEDALQFFTSSETVDQATRNLDVSAHDKQVSQNTDEEGVFLSKSAMERMRKLLSVDGDAVTAVLKPGQVQTFTLVLSDALSVSERSAWLDRLKSKYPSYADGLAKPKAVVFSASRGGGGSGNSAAVAQHPPPPRQRQPPPQQVQRAPNTPPPRPVRRSIPNLHRPRVKIPLPARASAATTTARVASGGVATMQSRVEPYRFSGRLARGGAAATASDYEFVGEYWFVCFFVSVLCAWLAVKLNLFGCCGGGAPGPTYYAPSGSSGAGYRGGGVASPGAGRRDSKPTPTRRRRYGSGR